MNFKRTIKLVEGIFTKNDANEVVDHLLQSKINFHCRRAFGLQERLGVRDDFSSRRVDELKSDKEALKEYLAEAERSGKQIELSGTLHLSFTDKEPTLVHGQATDDSACY